MKMFCKVCVCISAFFLLMMYSVKDFADVKVVGYTEHGTLSIKVNESTVNQIYADGKKDKTAALRFAETFKFTYDGQDDEDSYFSNGDVVVINVSYDNNMASALGLNFVDSSFEYKIEGLEDKVEVSPFDDLRVKFSGVAPYGSVQLDKSNCIQYVIDNVTFLCDNYDLSNGDKVVVRAEFNSEIAERNGYIFTEDVKKYTVVGLPKYVKTMASVNYDETTAKMRKMVETYVNADDESYKSLDWYFGDENTDSDTDEEALTDEAGLDEDQDDSVSGNEEDGEAEEEAPVFANFEGGDYDSDSDEETESKPKKTKKISDATKIKNDFVLSDFDAKFEYTPVSCYYALNSLQYSDNIFYSVYKVKGTFVCTDTNGSGFVKIGDTVVGEIYAVAKLSGGSVDIKNNLYYEDSVLKNFHSYSIHSVPTKEALEDELFGSTTYMVETLEYVESQEAYDDFSNKLNQKTVKKEESHITIDTSTDTDKPKKRNTSSQNTESTESSDEDIYSDEDVFPNDDGETQYYDDFDNEEVYDDDENDVDYQVEYELY